MTRRGLGWAVIRVALALACLVRGEAATAQEAPPAQTETIVRLPLIQSPSAGQRLVIGYSVAGRPLEAYRFGYGPRQKLILAGIHGGYEWNTIELAKQLMAFIEDHPGILPPGQTLTILPALNPDGEARSHWIAGRANDNGVDINRNFDHNWKARWRPEGCWNYLPITAGTGPFSEPEAAALRAFLAETPVEALISYHSRGAEIYAGGVPADPASESLALALEAASGYAYPPRVTGCEETGQLINWASTQGIAAVDVELAEHQTIDLEPNLRILEAFLQWSPPRQE